MSRDRNLSAQRSHIMFTVLKTGRGHALHVIVCGLVLFAWVGRDSSVAAQSTDTIQNSRFGSEQPPAPRGAATTSGRLGDLLEAAESLRAAGDNWAQWWLLDQPSHMTPFRTEGGNGP